MPFLANIERCPKFLEYVLYDDFCSVSCMQKFYERFSQNQILPSNKYAEFTITKKFYV